VSVILWGVVATVLGYTARIFIVEQRFDRDFPFCAVEILRGPGSIPGATRFSE
jgi:hypothetical protein